MAPVKECDVNVLLFVLFPLISQCSRLPQKACHGSVNFYETGCFDLPSRSFTIFFCKHKICEIYSAFELCVVPKISELCKVTSLLYE